MGEVVRLESRAADRFALSAWREPTLDARRGGLVVAHAIWGVTPHLRELAAAYAEDGYEVLVPSLFDRLTPDWPTQDTDPGLLQRQFGFGERTGWGLETLGDMQAAIDRLAPPVFVMGFCFGGNVAWLSAARCEGVAASACFYGGQIVQFIDEVPRCPLILHFGKFDEMIPPDDVARIAAAHPDLPVFQYETGHAFVAPSGHHADSARLSRLRTLQLFHAHTGAKGEMGG